MSEAERQIVGELMDALADAKADQERLLNIILDGARRDALRRRIDAAAAALARAATR